MKFNPDSHHRRSIRLQGYDYSLAGAYFITICTKNRECLFGEIITNGISLNNFGMIARDEWIKSAAIRFEIELDEFVVMPNHFHGIVVIHGRGDRPVAPTDFRPVAPTDFRPVAPTDFQPDPDQPRNVIDPDALTELTASIAKFGIIQPLLFRVEEGNPYLIIVAGERRFQSGTAGVRGNHPYPPGSEA